VNIDQRKNEGGQRKAAEPERCRICELAEKALVWLGVEIDRRGGNNGRLVGLAILSRCIVLRLEVNVVVRIASHFIFVESWLFFSRENEELVESDDCAVFGDACF
jgi:hypothetical protein